ncbi:MAG: sugar phosphate nucleotidyltransferase [Sulfolobales archaeon]|nr:sugar phosphate nucleotidyltransferase [Sulfolobales archaeon]MDW8082454.1 sugar phosphate nucleotidyltransferase [Sulfolobales archaeon]
MILAAGFGRGLEPITHTRPKPLIPILDRTLIEYHLDNLTKVSTIKRVVVVASYMMEKVREKLKSVEDRYPFDIEVVDQGAPLGSGHALLKGLETVSRGDVLVIYVDSAYSVDDLKEIAESSHPYLVAGYRVGDSRDYGVLVTKSTGELEEVIEKPPQPASNLVNAGIYRLAVDIATYLEKIELSPRGEYELTDALRLLVRGGSTVRVRELTYWRDLGRSWRYLDFCKEILYEKVKTTAIFGDIEESVRIRGPIYVGENAEILSGTYVEGPVFIGKGARVGPNAYIRPGTIVMNEARIGFSVEVKESIVMEGVHASHLSYIGDSIICEHSNLGAGTITANLRLDDREIKVAVKKVKVSTGRRKLGALVGGYVKTGVNVSINPGVKIGAYSRVFPGLVLYEDIPPCSVVKSDGTISTLPPSECPISRETWL